MTKNPFAPQHDALPQTMAIFPLTGALLLPHGNLPLNIFEPRYLAMIDDAMAGSRMIGMIQSKEEGGLYQTGCAGKITEFSETTDGRYIINLSGVCRFKVKEELSVTTLYRQVKTDWEDFKNDIETKKCLGVDREKLMELLEEYFTKEGMSCDFNKFKDIEDGALMTCLSMVCPFEPAEKQALLEKICCKERATMFMTMLEMAVKTLDQSPSQCH